nr:PREDICTED: uncharacterized protein LOC102365748 isoform X2 [Latimeria chalumnae]|eukprot:XP_014345155.1 PREDICTED: uncharacterized protein LOC102365748 isoform X2 [Latimeria chalumnae]
MSFTIAFFFLAFPMDDPPMRDNETSSACQVVGTFASKTTTSTTITTDATTAATEAPSSASTPQATTQQQSSSGTDHSATKSTKTNQTIAASNREGLNLLMIGVISAVFVVLVIILVGIILVLKCSKAKPSQDTQPARPQHSSQAIYQNQWHLQREPEESITYANLNFNRKTPPSLSQEPNIIYAEVKSKQNPRELQTIYASSRNLV